MLLGVVVGFLAGLFGIGGGVLIVTVLSTSFKYLALPKEIIMHASIGTSLACILVTAMSSMHTHHKNKNVIWGDFKKLLSGIVLGTIFGSLFASFLNNEVLEIIFACFLTLIFLKMLFIKTKEGISKDLHYFVYVLVGTIIGFKSSILGIGGGTISIPLLTWTGRKMRQAVGVSASLGVPIALVGTISYIYNGWGVESPLYSLGYVQLIAFFGIISTSWYFAKVGAKVSHRMDQKKLKYAYTVFLGLMLIKSYYEVFS